MKEKEERKMFAYISSYFSSIWNSIFGPLLMLTSLQRHPHKKGRLLVLGLDNAGKTTLLQAIRRLDTTTNTSTQSSNSTDNNNNTNTNLRSYPPTDRPEHIKNIVTINHQITFHAYDLGGHEAVRHLWSDYYNTSASSSSSNGNINDNNDTDTNYTNNTNLAILFCIDIADRLRVDEAAYELDALIHDGLNNTNHNNTNSNKDNDDYNNNNDRSSTDSNHQIYNNHDSDTTTAVTTKSGIPIAILLTKCDDMHEVVVNTSTNNNSNTSTTSTQIQPHIMTLAEVCESIDYRSLQDSHNGPMHICTVSVYKNTGYVEALQWITKTLLRQQQQQQR